MRIAFFSDTFYPSINGVATSVVKTAEHFTQRGHEVLVVVPSFNESPQQYNFTVYYTPSVNGLVYPEFRVGLPDHTLLSLVKNFRPDIIHTHSPFSVGLQGVLLAKHLHIPLVATHHTYFTDEESLKALGLHKIGLMKHLQHTADKMLAFYFNRHDLIIAPSQDTYKDLMNKKVTPVVEVLPSFVEINALVSGKKYKKQLRARYNIDTSLLYVGRVSGEKNIDLIISVFSEISRKLPQLQLVIIGDGMAKPGLQELAEELGVAEKIVWVGKVPHDKLMCEGYYYLGDIFISLSCFETLGLSLIEAMACGLPVVGANAKATTEAVKNIGELVDPHDFIQIEKAIMKLLKNKDAYVKCSKNSAHKAQEYAPEKVMKKLETIYQDLLHRIKIKSAAG